MIFSLILFIMSWISFIYFISKWIKQHAFKIQLGEETWRDQIDKGFWRLIASFVIACIFTYIFMKSYRIL